MTRYLYDTITGTYDDPDENFEKTIASQLDRLKPVKDWLTNFWDPYHASGGSSDTKDFSTVPDELDQERTIKLQALIALAREVHNQYIAHENHFKSGLKTSIDNLDRCWQGTPTKNVNRVLIKIQDRNTVHTSAIAQLEQRLNAVPDTIINAVTEKVDVVLGGTSEGRIYQGNTTAKAVVNFSKLEGQPDHCHYRKDGHTIPIPLKDCKDLVNAANSKVYDLTYHSPLASKGCFYENDIKKVAKSPEAVGYLQTVLKYYKIFHGPNHGTDITVPAASDKPHILPAHHGGSASGHNHGHFPGKHIHKPPEYNTSKLLEFNKDVIAQFRHNYEEIANTCIDADEVCAERITDSINKAADAAQGIDIDQEITDSRLPRCYCRCGGGCTHHEDHQQNHTTDLHTVTGNHQEGEHTAGGTGPGTKPQGGGTQSDVDVDKILSAISALRNNGGNGQSAQGGGAGGAAGGAGGGPSGSGGSANIPAIPGPYQFNGGDPPESVGRPHHRISHYHGGRHVSDDAEHIDEHQGTPPVTTDTTPATDETPPAQQDTPISTTSSPVEGITIERHSVGAPDDSPEPAQPEEVPDETGDEEWTAD